jgi:hypothetical protein
MSPLGAPLGASQGHGASSRCIGASFRCIGASSPSARRPHAWAAARELRDRWLEHVNNDPSVLMSDGKYEINRLIAPAERIVPLLMEQRAA